MPARPTARSPLRLLLALLVALPLVGCGTAPTPPPTATLPASSPAPSGTPRPPTAVLLAQVRAAVADIRGLEPTADVEPVVIDEATLHANLEAEFDAENPAARVALMEDLFVTLGLLPDGASLRELNLALLAGQVAGYYSPDRGELYVVSRSGGVGPVELATYAHEFTHQLQDQHFDLDALGLDAIDQGDRALATLALIEGDASVTQSTWMQGALTPEELGEIFQASLDPAALDALRQAPAILREQALFPYRDGLALVTAITAGGGFEALNAAYARLPASTEQVLHPQKYLAGEAPLSVALPDGLAERLGGGWIEAAQDTLGEQLLRVWLREAGLSATDARVAADGWGGDRGALFRGPDGQLAVALVTEWDDAAEAAEFAAALPTVVSGLGLTARIVQGGSTRVAIALGDHAIELAGGLGG